MTAATRDAPQGRTGGAARIQATPTPEPAAAPGRRVRTLEAGANMTPPRAACERQISGYRDGEGYLVGRVLFDGCRRAAGRRGGTLLETKLLADDGNFARLHRNFQAGDLSEIHTLFDRGGSLLQQGIDQARAARGTGATIKWHVSGEQAACALRLMFEAEPETRGIIRVIHTPAE